jgi:hypothetical protein
MQMIRHSSESAFSSNSSEGTISKSNKLKLLFCAGVLAMLILPLTPLTIADARIGGEPDGMRNKPTENDVQFTTLEKGAMSGVKSQRYLAIRDDASWLAMWRQHTSGAIHRTVAPHVDFDQSMVIAVFQGDDGESPGLVSIDRIRYTDDKLVVSLAESDYDDEGTGARSTTRSYHIVRLAKNSLPVVFR